MPGDSLRQPPVRSSECRSTFDVGRSQVDRRAQAGSAEVLEQQSAGEKIVANTFDVYRAARGNGAALEKPAAFEELERDIEKMIEKENDNLLKNKDKIKSGLDKLKDKGYNPKEMEKLAEEAYQEKVVIYKRQLEDARRLAISSPKSRESLEKIGFYKKALEEEAASISPKMATFLQAMEAAGVNRTLVEGGKSAQQKRGIHSTETEDVTAPDNVTQNLFEIGVRAQQRRGLPRLSPIRPGSSLGELFPRDGRANQE